VSELVRAFNEMAESLEKRERALKESEEKYRELYEESKKTEEVYRPLLHSSAEAMVLYDMEGRAGYVSPAFRQIFGWTLEDVKGQRIPFVPDSEREETTAIIKGLVEYGTPCHGFETKRFTKDGRLLDISVSASRYNDHEGNPSGLIAVLRDISKKKRLEAQLQRAQRMEAIGTLAGGIAHDFNNLMMGMLGNVSLILSDLDAEHPFYAKLKKIEGLIQNGAKLTGQLLGYARKGKYEVRPVSLNQIVEESSETFGRTKKEITISRELSEDLFAVSADEAQIHQILLNLYVNAADAMPGGGDLIISTRNVAHQELCDKPYKPKGGNYVELKVVDNGVGMDAKTADRIFDPFFTTKKMGRGTGLGLASAYGIIKGHGGYIDVDSEIGRGTTFSVYLPASEESVPKAPQIFDRTIPGTETIMIVDDEKMVCEVGCQMLEILGYRVFEANSGSQALEIYKQNRDAVDLVILDMIMPKMGGGETYDKLKEIDGDVEVLLSTGYSIDGDTEAGLQRFYPKTF
jgi:PAS domain S-box-containing protein